MRARRYRSALLAAALGAMLLIGIAGSRSSAQSPGREWEKAAGGKMAFDVASVKPAAQGEFYHSNFPLTLGSNFGPVGNLMSVAAPVRNLVGFAY